jgi:hypothetical protein
MRGSPLELFPAFRLGLVRNDPMKDATPDSVKLAVALDLLERAVGHISSAEMDAPDAHFMREYFTLTRESSFEGDYGWESIESLSSYTEDDPGWEPDDIIDFRDGNGPTIESVAEAIEARKLKTLEPAPCTE